jgi:hypothetical protein
MDTLKNKQLIRAKQRIEEIKKFYKHAVAYVLINLFLAFVWNFTFKIFGDFVISNQFDGDNFTYLPIWLIWGVFLAAHAIKTFGFPNAFGKDWEDRKIKEFMKK